MTDKEQQKNNPSSYEESNPLENILNNLDSHTLSKSDFEKVHGCTVTHYSKFGSLCDTLLDRGFTVKVVKSTNGSTEDSEGLSNLYLAYTDNSLKEFPEPYKQTEIEENNCFIYEKDTNKIVCRNIPKSYELTPGSSRISNYDMFLNKYENETFVVNDYIDGTVIRLYWYDGCWRVSTNKTIDAYTSFWNSKSSFGKLFEETYKAMSGKNLGEGLSKENTYVFMLSHPSNRAVNTSDKKTLYLLAIIDNKTGMYKKHDECYINPPEYRFRSLKEALEELNSNDTGLVLSTTISGSKVYFKYKNNKFEEAKSLKGNTTNMQFRYLELLKEDHENKTKKAGLFLLNFPEASYALTNFQLFVKSIHTEYINCYVNKIQYPRWYTRALIDALHVKYTVDRKKTTHAVVYAHMLTLDTKYVYWMLNRDLHAVTSK